MCFFVTHFNFIFFLFRMIPHQQLSVVKSSHQKVIKTFCIFFDNLEITPGQTIRYSVIQYYQIKYSLFYSMSLCLRVWMTSLKYEAIRQDQYNEGLYILYSLTFIILVPSDKFIISAKYFRPFFTLFN